MKIINYTELNGKFIFNIPSKGIYLIDNSYHDLPSGEVVLDKLPKKINKIIEKSVLTHYESTDGNGRVFTVEEYEEGKIPLQKKGRYEEYSWYFDDLDDEYNYKKYLRSWKAVYELQKVVDEELILERVVVIDLSHPYIRPMRHLGENITNPMCYLAVSPNSLLADAAKKFGFTEKPDGDYKDTKGRFWSNSNHSGWEYATINGSYVNTSDVKNHRFLNTFSAKGTFEECEMKLKRLQDHIEHKFAIESAKITDADMNPQLRRSVLELAGKIKSAWRNVVPHAKSHSSYRNVGQYITEMENKLKDEAPNT